MTQPRRAPAAAAIAGAVVFATAATGCGSGDSATQPAEAAVVPRDATSLCRDWLEADRHRTAVLEHWARAFGGDPSNASAAPGVDSPVVRLAASPYFEVYYDRLTLLATGDDAAVLDEYADAWSDAVEILRATGVNDEIIDAVAAAYGDSGSLSKATDGPMDDPMVGLQAESGVVQFTRRFAELPPTLEADVDEAEATLWERCGTEAT